VAAARGVEVCELSFDEPLHLPVLTRPVTGAEAFCSYGTVTLTRRLLDELQSLNNIGGTDAKATAGTFHRRDDAEPLVISGHPASYQRARRGRQRLTSLQWPLTAAEALFRSGSASCWRPDLFGSSS
jgi:hypothetical protein